MVLSAWGTGMYTMAVTPLSFANRHTDKTEKQTDTQLTCQQVRQWQPDNTFWTCPFWLVWSSLIRQSHQRIFPPIRKEKGKKKVRRPVWLNILNEHLWTSLINTLYLVWLIHTKKTTCSNLVESCCPCEVAKQPTETHLNLSKRVNEHISPNVKLLLQHN